MTVRRADRGWTACQLGQHRYATGRPAIGSPTMTAAITQVLPYPAFARPGAEGRQHYNGAPPMMTTADDQIEYLPLFVYGTLLERPTRDSVLGPSVLRTERAAARGRWENATDYPAASFRDPVSEISGELVWLIPERLEASLQRADRYEGAPRLYRRVLIHVRAGEKVVRAYAYEWARSA